MKTQIMEQKAKNNPEVQICSHCGQETLDYQEVHDLILCEECEADYWKNNFHYVAKAAHSLTI